MIIPKSSCRGTETNSPSGTERWACQWDKPHVLMNFRQDWVETRNQSISSGQVLALDFTTHDCNNLWAGKSASSGEIVAKVQRSNVRMGMCWFESAQGSQSHLQFLPQESLRRIEAVSAANSADFRPRDGLRIPRDGKVGPEFFHCLPTTRRTLPFARELGRRLANIRLSGRVCIRCVDSGGRSLTHDNISVAPVSCRI